MTAWFWVPLPSLTHHKVWTSLAVVVAAGLIGLGWAVASKGAVTDQAPGRSCPQLILYFSRGSGQSLAEDPYGLDSPGKQLYAALRDTYREANVASFVNGYLAVSIKVKVLRFGLPKIPSLGKYLASVANGVQTADRNIVDVAAVCPQSKLVVAGYSQ